MKIKVFPYVLAVLFMINCMHAAAQHTTVKTAVHGNTYPTTFTIAKNDFDNLFLYKANEPVASKTNKYLDKAALLKNSSNGDMKFLKLKLDYFKHAFMLVQVNGTYSTQVFIMSDDKSVFYKGHFEKNVLIMSKCSEDDIVSE
jgi:hypothetical protein